MGWNLQIELSQLGVNFLVFWELYRIFDFMHGVNMSAIVEEDDLIDVALEKETSQSIEIEGE